MHTVKVPDFSLSQIASSGQCFRMNYLVDEELWEIIALNKRLKIKETTNNCFTFYCSLTEYNEVWTNYFDLNRDYASLKKMILKSNDLYLIKSVNYGWGIRILKQDVWEIIVSFLISQRNNIKRIKSTIKKLCTPHGDSFPSPFMLKDYSLNDFKQIGLGYRATYLLELIKIVILGDFDIEYLKTLEDHEALLYLKKIKGIGDKVANCVLLFGLNRLGAFPLDVWMKRIILKHYNGHFDIGNFADYAGILQQYMFFYARSVKN